MNTLFNIIITLVVTVGFSFLAGPIGGLVILAIILGVIISINQRSMEIYNDLQKIKEHLGIKEINEFEMNNEDIERELEDAYMLESNNQNQEIKNELEEDFVRNNSNIMDQKK